MEEEQKIKISELESANRITTTDVVPIVQNGETKKVNILNTIYPIGSIYISILNTDPATLFGGSWQRFGQGRTLVGLNTQDEDFDTLLKAGGEKKHTLTVDEMPSHNHQFNTVHKDIESQAPNYAINYAYTSEQPLVGGTESKGGGQPHNILQPYIVVSMWVRVS